MQQVKIILWFHIFPQCPALYGPAGAGKVQGEGEGGFLDQEKQKNG